METIAIPAPFCHHAITKKGVEYFCCRYTAHTSNYTPYEVMIIKIMTMTMTKTMMMIIRAAALVKSRYFHVRSLSGKITPANHQHNSCSNSSRREREREKERERKGDSATVTVAAVVLVVLVS